MYFGTTDGKDVNKWDVCASCKLSTGGEHERNCPMAQGYKLRNAENAKLTEDLFLVGIEDWPSWDNARNNPPAMDLAETHRT